MWEAAGTIGTMKPDVSVPPKQRLRVENERFSVSRFVERLHATVAAFLQENANDERTAAQIADSARRSNTIGNRLLETARRAFADYRPSRSIRAIIEETNLSELRLADKRRLERALLAALRLNELTAVLKPLSHVLCVALPNGPNSRVALATGRQLLA